MNINIKQEYIESNANKNSASVFEQSSYTSKNIEKINSLEKCKTCGDWFQENENEDHRAYHESLNLPPPSDDQMIKKHRKVPQAQAFEPLKRQPNNEIEKPPKIIEPLKRSKNNEIKEQVQLSCPNCCKSFNYKYQYDIHLKSCVSVQGE